MSAPRYRAVIFDLDGVICSTDRFHYLAWKQVADRLGIPFDESVNNLLRGVGRMESLEIILSRGPQPFTAAEKLALAEEKNALYRAYLTQMTPGDVAPEVTETLQQLRAKGILLGVGSSSKNTKLILRQIGLEGFFDAISDGTNITRSKPDPEVFLQAAAFLAVPPELCLVVEDAKAGIEAAAAGGMDSAAVGDAKRYGIATYDLEHFGDLVGVVGGQEDRKCLNSV